MAAVPVTIVGVLADKLNRTIQNVTLFGEMTRSDRQIGGGPLPPGESEPGEPPSVWPGDEHPEHPIYIPPEIWPNPPEGQAPHPEHPIVIPPPAGTDGPPLEVKVVWTEENGWAVVLIPTGEHPAPSGARPPGPSNQPVPPPGPSQQPPRPPQPTPRGVRR